MKNPKVGERVKFFTSHAGWLKARIAAVKATDLWVQSDCGLHTFIDTRDAIRLVPKKRERTYTEAEVKAAVAGALSPIQLTDWPVFDNIMSRLREGSGR